MEKLIPPSFVLPLRHGLFSALQTAVLQFLLSEHLPINQFRLITTATGNPILPFGDLRSANGGIQRVRSDKSLRYNSELQPINPFPEITLATVRRTLPFSDHQRDSGLFFGQKIIHSSPSRLARMVIFPRQVIMMVTENLMRRFFVL
jgi:hypothetical protein